MKLGDLNLKAKVLWIPVCIVAVTFIIMAVFLTRLVINNGQAENIKGKEKQLYTGLSLMASSQLPADALLALEGDDDGIAEDLMNQVKGLGLDAVYFAGLEGKLIYPKDGSIPDDLSSVMSKTAQTQGAIRILLNGNSMVGFTPIIDVETPKGFLVFTMNVPVELVEIASSILNNDEASVAEENSEGFLKKILLTMVTILVPSLVLITIVLSSTSRNIIGPVRQLLKAFRRLSDGDLTQEIEVRTRDEVAQLAEAFNQTNHKLNEMVNKVSDSSSSVATSASQLSASSNDINDHAQNQSTKTTQAASAMEELNSSFVNVAQNSVNAADSAKEAAELASKGGETVTETISGMNRIANSVRESAKTIEALGSRSEQIGEIIKVINDIAGQTNLLALNAAIEAARAGEQGRGFAVVADEVRKLAERTTSATNEIGDMVKGIQDDTGKAVESMQSGTLEVEEGLRSADQAGEALQRIVSSVQNVTDMIQQIATAAEEQSSTGDEVATNIESVADITRQTADAVQNSSQETHHLDELAQELRQLVSGFKLRSGYNGEFHVDINSTDVTGHREANGSG